MSQRLKRLVYSARMLLVVTLPTLILLGILLELAARTVLPTSDVPDVLFDPDLGNHFRPNQRGTYIAGLSAEIRARYRINNKGWNSPYDYANEPSAQEVRLAVIGDSFVEALQVDHDQSFPYLLEQTLQEKYPDCRIRVYTFGHAGANLAQYTKVAQHVMQTYRPSLLILNVVHNDFLESLEPFARVDNWSLRPGGDSFTFIAPRQSDDLARKRWLRRSAIIRYLVINMRMLDRLYVLKQRLNKSRRFEANIDPTTMEAYIHDGILEHALDYLLGMLHQVTGRANVLFVIDGNRRAIYDGDDPRKTFFYRMNQLLRKQTYRYNFPLIDLTDWFEDDWKREGEPFNWAIDYHWNQRGHGVAAAAIGEFIAENQRGYFCAE